MGEGPSLRDRLSWLRHFLSHPLKDNKPLTSAKITKAVIGLGNPGPRYAFTRHNAGFMALDRLASFLETSFQHRGFHSEYGIGWLEDQPILLAKPQTYMNESGRAVKAMVDYYHFSPSDLLVLYDDVSLPLGRIRVRARGSHGGHQGLRSVLSALGTEEVPRIRIGIGAPPPGQDLVSYVLSPFSSEEWTVVRESIARAAEAVLVVLREGIATAMNRYNVKG